MKKDFTQKALSQFTMKEHCNNSSKHHRCNMNVPTQYVYYKFTKSATHLLSLVSGVPENYIKNVRLEEFNLQRESNSITLGDSPENTRMLVSPEYFNEENISKRAILQLVV